MAAKTLATGLVLIIALTAEPCTGQCEISRFLGKVHSGNKVLISIFLGMTQDSSQTQLERIDPLELFNNLQNAMQGIKLLDFTFINEKKGLVIRYFVH